MKPEAQRIAIAEWCGWKLEEEHIVKPDGKVIDCEFLTEEAVDRAWPDYLNDLNAMHEAEGKLPETRRGYYNAELSKIAAKRNLSSAVKEPQFIFDCIHATAAQRAEALLKTIGKWVEE